MSRLRLLTTTALLLWTSPALPSTIILTVMGTVAPYTWDGRQFTSAPLVDTLGIFGTPGEALFGDPFTTIWIVDSETRIGTATLTINGGTVFFEPDDVRISITQAGSIYANTTIIPGIRAMNTFTGAEDDPRGIGGSFRHSGVWGYLSPESFVHTNLFPHIPSPPPPPPPPSLVPGPAAFGGIPGLFAGALYLLFRRRKNVT